MIFLFLIIWVVVGFFSTIQFITRVLQDDADEEYAPLMVIGSIFGFLTCMVLAFVAAGFYCYRRFPGFFKAKGRTRIVDMVGVANGDRIS